MELSFTMMKYLLVAFEYGDSVVKDCTFIEVSTRSLEEELQIDCSKCGKRLATDKDGFCDPCRFSDILTQMTEKR